MTSTGTRKPRDVQSRASEAIIENDKELVQSLKIFAESSNATAGLAGPAINNSPKTPAGNYIAREGDSMIGPLALGPPLDFRVEIDANNTIDIGPLNENAQYSSNIELDSIQPNSFILNIIANAAFDGQILLIRTFGPDSFTINQGNSGNGGNIQTPTSDDFILEPLQMIVLIFDEALIIGSNTGGTWRVLSVSGSGGSTGTGTFISAALSGDQITNLAVGEHVEFDTNTPPTGADGGIILQTGVGQVNGIFELLAGKTYFLSGVIRPGFGGSNQVQFAWYDITNGTEIGRRTIFDDTVFPQNQPLQEIIYTPTTDVTVELRIVFITTPSNLTSIDSGTTMASIFEFSGQNGIPGSDAAPTWKLPARSKSVANVPNLATFTVLNDGVTLVENDRVLLTNQDTLSENGLWQVGVVVGGIAPLTRPDDFDTSDKVLSETFVAIEEGSLHKNQLWHLTSNNPLTIDVSDQIWNEIGGAQTLGPDIGQDDEGFDASGQFVFDGRISTANFITQRWDSVSIGTGPNNSTGKILYIPSFGERAARLVVIGGQTGTATSNCATSEDLGDNWIQRSSFNTEDLWAAMAYDPTGRGGKITDPQGILVAGSSNGVFNTSRNLKRSVDRGENWSTIFSPNTDLHRDLIFAQPTVGLGQFVITNYATGGPPPSQNRGIWTSPDGSTWTVRTTPIPLGVNQSWSFVAYSPSLNLYIATTLGQTTGLTDIMTSSDGINWILHTSNITLYSIQRIIWSEGQQKFVMLTVDPSDDIIYSNTSIDGINWEQFEVARVFEGSQIVANDIVWAPNLSTYVICGSRVSTGHRFEKFWVSQDAENWSFVPRMPDLTNTSQLASIAYSDEYSKFFAINLITSSNYTVYRTTR